MKNKMKKARFFVMMLLSTTMLLAVGCSKIDVDDSNNDGGGSAPGNGNGGETTLTIPQLIKKHVTVSATYNEYVVSATLTSTLESVLPDKAIRYRYEYGYLRNDENEELDLDCGAYLTKNSNSYKGDFLVFYDAGYSWPFGTQGRMHYNAYIFYKNKIQQGETLVGEDLEAYNLTCRYLTENEKKAAEVYTGRFVVEVNSQRYLYKFVHLYGSNTIHISVSDN